MDTQTKNKSQKTLTFLHYSIRDYFAAEHIQNRWTKEEKKARRYVRKRRYNPVWQETIVFLSGLLENPDTLLRTLVKPLWWEVLKAYMGGNGALFSTVGKCIGIDGKPITDYGKMLMNRFVDMAQPKKGVLTRKIPNTFVCMTPKEFLAALNQMAQGSAIKALAEIGSKEATEIVIKCLTDTDRAVRFVAIEGLVKIGSEEAGLALIRALDYIDDNIDVDSNSLIPSIKYPLLFNPRFHSKRIVEEAVKMLRESQSLEIREWISELLLDKSDLLPPEDFPYLFTVALVYKPGKVQRSAEMVCCNRFPSETEKCILQVLEDPECPPLLRERAIHTKTYNKIFSPKLRERLKQILFSVSEPSVIRGATVQPLFMRAGSRDEIEGLLEKCVHYHDSLVREFAAIYVASILFTHDYDKYLLQLLCDIDCKVSKEAAHALIKHGDAITIEKLENLLNTDISEKAAAAICNTIRGIEQTLLFSIDSKFQSDLDNAIILYRISESLRREFENHGSLLSKDSQVSIKKAGSGWVILGKNEHYLVRKEENKLNIYDKTLLKARLTI